MGTLGLVRLLSFDRTFFSYGYWPFHPILSPYEIPVAGPDFCRHRVPVDATGRRKCGHRRSRISFVFPSMLRRSLFFLDAGPPGVRFRLSLRLLLRLRQSTPLSARTMETVIAGQHLTQSRQDAKLGRLETQNIWRLKTGLSCRMSNGSRGQCTYCARWAAFAFYRASRFSLLALRLGGFA